MRQNSTPECKNGTPCDVKLAGALVLTSQGVPFLHSGVEFCRTKNGNGNSYKSPDSINQIVWHRKVEFQDVFEYYSKLIQLRKNHPAFRITTAEGIRQNLHFCTEYKIGVVSYCIDGAPVGDTWTKILLIFNGSPKDVNVPIPEGNFKIIANGDKISESGLGQIESNEVSVAGISMLLLVTD